MSQFDNQSELVQALRKQLEATQQELANQKWVFEQFLQSPSWRLTYPVRWLATRLRAIRKWTTGEVPEPQIPAQPPPDRAPRDVQADETTPALKEFLTSHYRVRLEGFLASGNTFQLPQSENPEISIILVLFNRAELTLACLRSITENFPPRLELIIVDNASSDKTSQLLDRLEGARIIRNKENLHFLLGVNQAVLEARGEYVLLLNNDAQLMPGSLSSALATIRSSPDIGAVGARIILLDGVLQEAGSIMWADGSCLGYGRGDDPFAPMYMFRRDVDYCSGAFLLTARATWERLGGFDETFRPAYYEETDYCARLLEQKLRVVYDPDAVIMHYEFASSASVRKATDLQRDHRQLFAERHRAMLQEHRAQDPGAVLLSRMRGGKKRVLFIDDRVPHTWLGSGFPRSRTILGTLLEQGFFVTFYPLDHFEESWSSVYTDMPAEVEFMVGYGPDLLEAFLRNRPGYYDTIFISRPHNMKTVQRVLSAHPEWFDHSGIIYDAEAVFVARDIAQPQTSGAPISEEKAADMLKEEMALAAHADCVVSVSESERRMFEKHGIDRIHILGHVLPAAPTTRLFSDRSGFLFAGAMRDDVSPNVDSIIWFVGEVWPRIQKRLGNEITLTIAGDNRSDRVRQLAGASVRITGPVTDLTDLYESARVFVAPTRYAAGIPHKVHEAAARGLPVVGTPLLASQLGWHDGEAFLVGADAESFAAKCIELYTSEALWTRIRETGLARIQEECSKELFQSQLMAIMQVAQKRLKHERMRVQAR